jgi:hypothetical protein
MTSTKIHNAAARQHAGHIFRATAFPDLRCAGEIVSNKLTIATSFRSGTKSITRERSVRMLA